MHFYGYPPEEELNKEGTGKQVLVRFLMLLALFGLMFLLVFIFNEIS